jgi:predicted nucleotidyltransferase
MGRWVVANPLQGKREAIAEMCARHGVAQLDAFGSALREDFRPDESDLDFLVAFKPMEPYARVEAYFGLLEDLRRLLGREIDLVMIGAVKNRYIAQDIQRTKQLLYAA